jgi:hypothetical protein
MKGTVVGQSFLLKGIVIFIANKPRIAFFGIIIKDITVSIVSILFVFSFSV